MRFLIRLKPTHLSREGGLQAVKSIARNLGADPRNPKWTSYGALELDVFCPSTRDFELFVTAVGPLAEPEFIRDLNVAPPFKDEEELIDEARALFNAERYWECHELLEGIWRTKKGQEKSLLQGIILVCAAFVHHQKGEEDVAIGVMRRAVKQLDYPTGDYRCISVPRLKRDVERVLRSQNFSNFSV